MNAITEVLTASTPDDLFKGLTGDELRKRFRKLKRQVHPDRYTDEWKSKAETAFNRLNELWDELNGKTRRPTTSAFTFATKNHTYVFGEVVFKDFDSTFYSAEYRVEDVAKKALVRFSQDPSSNQLLEKHAKALKKLKEEVDPTLGVFHPTFIEVARHRDSASGTERVVVVTEEVPYSDDTPTTYVSLLDAKLLRERSGYPIEARDMAWIFRRMLVALGTAHESGLVNQDVTLSNVFIRAADHGLLLFDWRNSAPLTEELRVADINALARAMEGLLEKSPYVPRQISAFMNGCKLSRLPLASNLLGEFDDLLERLYGPRKFREFVIPNETTEGN